MRDEVQFMRVRDIAPLLGLSTGRVFQMIRDRKLPVVREGRALFIPRPAFESWLQARADEALAGMTQPARDAELGK